MAELLVSIREVLAEDVEASAGLSSWPVVTHIDKAEFIRLARELLKTTTFVPLVDDPEEPSESFDALAR